MSDNGTMRFGMIDLQILGIRKIFGHILPLSVYPKSFYFDGQARLWTKSNKKPVIYNGFLDFPG